MLDKDELDEWLERGIAALVLALMLFAALALGGVRSTEFAILTGITLVTLVLWVVRFWLNPSHRFLLHPVVWPVLAFLGYAAWRHTQAPVPYVSRHELMHLSVYAAVVLLVLDNIHRQGLTQRVVGWVVVFVEAL
jgi:hypothetical protein